MKSLRVRFSKRWVLGVLCSPVVMFYCTILLIFLLCWGTWAQKNVGIYDAHGRFFASWFVSNDFYIPIPGTRLVLSVMIVNLICKLIFKNNWGVKNLGVNFTHIGVLILLLGGVYTAFFSREGSMSIEEGKSSGTVESFHDHELAITKHVEGGTDEVLVFESNWLKDGKILKNDGLPFSIKLINYYRNSRLEKGALESVYKPKGMTSIFHLKKLGYNPDKGESNAGLYFEIHGNDDKANGSYILLQYSQIGFKIKYDGVPYSFVLRGLRWGVPFKIKLVDFVKDFYPGSNIPKFFSSEVEVLDGGLSRRAIIEMNSPLRKNNFTVYQLKYIDRVPEVSVFAVVDNHGKYIPYLSSIVIAIGLFLHIFLKSLDRRSKSRIVLK